MKRVKKLAEEYCKNVSSGFILEDRVSAYEAGYSQALKDVKETFAEMSKNTDSSIDAVKALGSLLDNPVIRKKLGKSKPIPKKPVKTNPFFGGEKK